MIQVAIMGFGVVGSGVAKIIEENQALLAARLSDEIYVMYEGEISGHIAGSEATEEKIMQFSARNAKKSEKEGEAC